MNQVDHIVIGAPPKDVPLRGMLGTVQSAVSSDAAPEPLQAVWQRLGRDRASLEQARRTIYGHDV